MHPARSASASTTSDTMIVRMTRVLESFDRWGTRLSLEEIGTRARLPRSSCHRILEQLVQLGWVRRHTTGYSLGHRAASIGSRGPSREQVREAAAPVLLDLHVRTGLVVHLCMLEGPEVLFLDKLGGAYALTLPSDVGSRWWVTNATIGKTILAWLPPEEVDSLLGECAAPGGIDGDDPALLHAELAEIRRRGVGYERGLGMPGVGGVAAPILTADGPVAALSAVGPLERVDFERLAPLVRHAGRQTSEALQSRMREESDPLEPIPYRKLGPTRGWLGGRPVGRCCGKQEVCDRLWASGEVRRDDETCA
ncbi:IclR family transcriptional regulator [Nocardioides sp. zg-DK7169]|uniref:IclR family transcriptional regulator n=1 Tax=Nocardioides sp. zg-DK7169 TaxID=2736600 RepID=UPI00155471DA|nr:IclR family transcriptional regulator [Nocardioides sp. zg-DK7169]NPC98289.1 IclR family transcriptional regulator [Nocardioides sp. zg-DK7169]